MKWDEYLSQRLEHWQLQGLGRKLKTIQAPGIHHSQSKHILSFASNDYLSLATHPKVCAAAKSAIDQLGTGSGSSPLVCGHTLRHDELERDLANFKQSESALVFSSGYQSALAVLVALAGTQETIILDRLAHASLLDGAHLSGARVRIFKHNNLTDLSRLLEREKSRRCIVVVESLYSMDGDLAPLQEIMSLVETAGALLLVDEAHATGVLGISGRGALESPTMRHGSLPGAVIAMGTLSKALGSQGGFICASKMITDTIVHAGRAYLFSTALAPACAAAAREALKLIDSEPERRRHLMALSQKLRQDLKMLHLEIPDSIGPIIPVIVGNEALATRWSDELLKMQIYVPAIRYPTVRKGSARLRISLNAGHTEDNCQTLLNGLQSVSACP